MNRNSAPDSAGLPSKSNRREFLRTAAAGVGGAIATPALFNAATADAAPAESARTLSLASGRHRLELSATNGSILSLLADGANASLCRSGENGLWRLRFLDGSTLAAADFTPESTARHFQSESDPSANALKLTYHAPEAIVTVTIRAHERGFDLAGELKPVEKTALEFEIPGRLRFAPKEVRRFISPVHPGVGAAFNGRFFEPQPTDRVSGWQSANSGPAGYSHLFGAGLDMRDLAAPPVPVQATAAGNQWLGSVLAGKVAQAPPPKVNRAFQRKQADLVLLDSANGPFLAGSRLGGQGLLWRFGGQWEETTNPLAGEIVDAVIRKAASAPGARRKIALVDLRNGPLNGPYANLTVAQWRERLAQTAQAAPLTFISLRTPEQMRDAARSGEFLAILNPYGEWLPTPEDATLLATLDVLREFVKQGGHWFEVGGYSFYGAMHPSKFLKYQHDYPPAFSDFFHLETSQGRVSVYGLQPRDWKPWAGLTNPAALFVPGRLAFGGDASGGWCEHAFSPYVKAGQAWSAPAVRLSLNHTPEDDLQAYGVANGITRPLRDKMKPGLLEKFRRAVLVKYNGSAQAKLAALELLPVPTLIHWADYLKGGFDKEYPDHLPPNPQFGTAAEFLELHTRAHALGHLIMPYTNPTWWCDHPRGPTFIREGEAPLSVQLNGKPYYEKYARNDGWTICFWHPAVRAANRVTLDQFTQEYPSDILFQDQCGARGWLYDLNPASPTPSAYAEGMVSMVEEDCAKIPLSTEDGWDRVLNAEAQLCGFTFAMGGGRRPEWANEMKTTYHPATWELYPLNQRIAHDKAALLHHDLGKFVLDRPTLSWTLGLGFALSYVVAAQALKEPARLEWLRWLDRLQKSVCARYVGEPVHDFLHHQGPEESGDDGVIHAAYGPVKLIANLGPAPLRAGDRELAGYGFIATAPGLIAANLRTVAGLDFGETGLAFVCEGDANSAEIWVYAPGGTDAAIELPVAMSGEYHLSFEAGPASKAKPLGTVLRFRLPENAGSQNPRRVWHITLRN